MGRLQEARGDCPRVTARMAQTGGLIVWCQRTAHPWVSRSTGHGEPSLSPPLPSSSADTGSHLLGAAGVSPTAQTP